MKTRKIDAEEAKKISLTKTYGIMGDNCMGVWGEGDTIEEAKTDAEMNMLEYAGAVGFEECEIVTLNK